MMTSWVTGTRGVLAALVTGCDVELGESDVGDELDDDGLFVVFATDDGALPAAFAVADVADVADVAVVDDFAPVVDWALSVTLMVPVISGCTSHLYVNVPAAVKVWRKDAPDAIRLESNTPSAVAVCLARPRFVQTTVSPVCASTGSGENALSVMETSIVSSAPEEGPASVVVVVVLFVVMADFGTVIIVVLIVVVVVDVEVPPVVVPAPAPDPLAATTVTRPVISA
jgi:hypothetical protein